MSILSNGETITKIMDNAGNVIADLSRIGVETIVSEPALTFSSDGENLLDYTIYGNTGGVGVSKNLFDKDNADIVELYPDQNNGAVTASSNHNTHSLVIPLSAGKYTFSIYHPTNATVRNRLRVACYDSYPQVGDTPLYMLDRNIRDGDIVYSTFAAPPNTAYVMILLWSGSDYTVSVINDIVANNNIMLEHGFEHSTYAAYNSRYCIPIVMTGENEILNNVASQEINGLTVTRNGDGSLTLNGTATASTNFVLKNDSHAVGDYYQIDKDRYYISGSPEGSASNKYIMSYRYIAENSESSTIARVPSGGGILDNTNGDRNTIAPYITVWSGITCNNVTFRPALQKIKMVNIPVDSPLATGDRVSKADAGAYIPTFIGENTMTVDAVIQPTEILINGKIGFVSNSKIESTHKVRYYSQDGNTLLYEETVPYGGNAGGHVIAAQTSAFVGWNASANQTTATENVLQNITADKNVYAALSASERTIANQTMAVRSYSMSSTEVPTEGTFLEEEEVISEWA